MQPEFVGYFSCHILGGAVFLPKLMLLLSSHLLCSKESLSWLLFL